MQTIKRRLYKRGSSFETTIPRIILLMLDSNVKYNVIFKFDTKKKKWYLDFEKRKEVKK